MREDSAAASARELLHGAAMRLRTADPVEHLGDVLDESLSLPAGDDAYRRHRTLEPHFSETAAGSLAFDLVPGGPGASPADRLALATRAARGLTAHGFGRQALGWLDGRLEGAGGRGGSWGASLASGFGRRGLVESALHLEWGPQLLESLPARLHRLVQVAVNAGLGLRPVLSTVRTTPHGGSQQVTFTVPRAMALDRLRPLMDALGVGHQHASLMSAVALLLGARYTLPPDSCLVTLRPGRDGGVELRVDVDLDAIPDPPPQLTHLLRLHLTERPAGRRAFERWLLALTPEGEDSPGRLSLLSVVVRPDVPARLSLHLRPGVIERPRRTAAWVPADDGVPASAWLPAGAV